MPWNLRTTENDVTAEKASTILGSCQSFLELLTASGSLPLLPIECASIALRRAAWCSTIQKKMIF